MSSQNDKDGSPHVRAAVITGIFAVLAACIGGVCLVINTFINNGFVFAGAGNQNPYPTNTPISSQPISPPIANQEQPTATPTSQPPASSDAGNQNPYPIDTPVSSQPISPSIANQEQPTATPTSQPPSSSNVGKCPDTAENAANLFGGSANYWKRLAGFEQNAWKYGPAPAAPIQDINIPEGMKGDWWDNFNAHSQVGAVRGGFATEATIWCAP